MDLRTGRMYATLEEARAAGVPESDIAHVVEHPAIGELRKRIPLVEFSKRSPFGSFKNIKQEMVGADTE